MSPREFKFYVSFPKKFSLSTMYCMNGRGDKMKSFNKNSHIRTKELSKNDVT